MKKHYPFITLTLTLSLACSSIYGQETCCQEEDDQYSCAYIQSTRTAHWSIYLPIAILVGAAVWFGVSDKGHKDHHSSDSQDALGSIDNSKRHSKSNSTTSNSYMQGISRCKAFHSH